MQSKCKDKLENTGHSKTGIAGELSLEYFMHCIIVEEYFSLETCAE